MAGCILERFPPFHVPHGGYGLFLPKPFLEQLLQPLRTYNDKNLVEVIYEYVTEQPFSQYKNWTNGYCLHSDWCVCVYVCVFATVLAVP